MKRTKKTYENYLNNFYTPCQAWKVGRYMYKTNRGYINNYGTVLRQKDPIAFEVGFREWKGNC